MELRFFDHPADFLDVAGARLAEQPVLSTVMAGVADRIRDQLDAGVPWPEGVPCWFAVVVDERGDVLGTAMRTALFGEHPAYLLPMPDEAVAALVDALVERGEIVLGANGALPAVRVFCELMAKAVGKEARVGQHTRLFELGELSEPRHGRGPASAGRRRRAGRSSRAGTTRSCATPTSRRAARPGRRRTSPSHRRSCGAGSRAGGSSSGPTRTTSRST